MNEATKQLVRKWVAMHRGDVEGVAKYMRDSLRLGGLKACRAMVAEALS